MRIQRSRSRLSFRTRRKAKIGCTPFSVLLIAVICVGVASWRWIEARLSASAPPSQQTTLPDAQRAFDRGDLDGAISMARMLWQNNPNQTDALILLVRALVYRSYADYNRDIDRQIARQTTQTALERTPQNNAIRAIHAFALVADNEPIPAAQLAQSVLSQQPNDVLARVALALAYGRVGGHENAFIEAQKAVAQRDETYHIDSLRAQALSQSDLGRYADAMQTIQQAIAINNKLALLHFEHALFALQISDADTATAAYLSILAFSPDNVKARLRMCELYSALRDVQTATRYCADVVARAPSWSDGWYFLGREYYLQGNFASAKDALGRCTALQLAQNVAFNRLRLDCWYLQGQVAEVLGDCDTLTRLYNEFLTIVQQGNLRQTWAYPPEGPAFCQRP